jgi:hypothetical protein
MPIDELTTGPAAHMIHTTTAVFTQLAHMQTHASRIARTLSHRRVTRSRYYYTTQNQTHALSSSTALRLGALPRALRSLLLQHHAPPVPPLRHAEPPPPQPTLRAVNGNEPPAKAPKSFASPPLLPPHSDLRAASCARAASFRAAFSASALALFSAASTSRAACRPRATTQHGAPSSGAPSMIRGANVAHATTSKCRNGAEGMVQGACAAARAPCRSMLRSSTMSFSNSPSVPTPRCSSSMRSSKNPALSTQSPVCQLALNERFSQDKLPYDAQ